MTASTSIENTINIKLDEINRNFFMFYKKEVVDYAPDEAEYNYIYQRFNLFCIDDMIFSVVEMFSICRVVSFIVMIHLFRWHLHHM